MAGGAWRETVCGVKNNQTRLSDAAQSRVGWWPWAFTARAQGSILGRGNQMPQAEWRG